MGMIDIHHFEMEDEIRKLLTALEIKTINFFVSNLDGKLFCMEENADNLHKYIKYGLGIDGSSVPGYASIEKSDIMLFPDLSTFQVLTVNKKMFALMFANIYSDSAKEVFHNGDPRGILSKVLDELHDSGYMVEMMSELEFITLNKNDKKPIDEGTYMALPPDDQGYDFRHDLLGLMHACGMKIKRLHHENAPGQQEVEYELTKAKKNADDSLLGIWLTRLESDAHGWNSDFSPKPLGPDQAGNGLHMHVILRKKETNENLFKGEKTGQISEIGKKFVAGILKYSPEMTSVFARSSESFMRLTSGHEAPTKIAWGYANRSALVRVPRISAGGEDSTRIEFRAGDASGSPHLLAASILKAGLQGIKEDLAPVEPIERNLDIVSDEKLKEMGVASLPQTKEECKKIISNSKFMKEFLNEHIMEYFKNYEKY